MLSKDFMGRDFMGNGYCAGIIGNDLSAAGYG